MNTNLSARETQIAHLIGEGKTFRSISDSLDLAVSTVGNYAARISKKLGAHGREGVCSKLLEQERRVPIEDLRRWRECARTAERAGTPGSKVLREELDALLRRPS